MSGSGSGSGSDWHCRVILIPVIFHVSRCFHSLVFQCATKNMSRCCHVSMIYACICDESIRQEDTKSGVDARSGVEWSAVTCVSYFASLRFASQSVTVYDEGVQSSRVDVNSLH